VIAALLSPPDPSSVNNPISNRKDVVLIPCVFASIVSSLN